MTASSSGVICWICKYYFKTYFWGSHTYGKNIICGSKVFYNYKLRIPIYDIFVDGFEINKLFPNYFINDLNAWEFDELYLMEELYVQ